MTRTHLVTGVGGQDGVLLARLLRQRGERVIGTTSSGSAKRLGLYLDGIEIVELDVRDTAAFAALVEKQHPHAVYNLAAMSSVSASWQDPQAAEEINHTAVVGMLDVVGGLASPPAFVQASSSEIFGPGHDRQAVDETSGLAPASPYAEAKASAHRAVAEARSGGLHATNLVLFGHSCPLQAPTFALPSLSRQAAEAGLGRRSRLSLRDPGVRRDWGSAPDFVRAFDLAVAGPPGDYVIATGELHELAELGRWALAAAGAPSVPVVASGETVRRNDFPGPRGVPARAKAGLGWEPLIPLRREIERMVAVDTARLRSGLEHSVAYLEPGASS